MPVYLFLVMVLLLFEGCSRRSRAWKFDSVVACADPFSLMWFGLPDNYRYGVSQVVCVEEIYAQPFTDWHMCLRTVAL